MIKSHREYKERDYLQWIVDNREELEELWNIFYDMLGKYDNVPRDKRGAMKNIFFSMLFSTR